MQVYSMVSAGLCTELELWDILRWEELLRIDKE